jgi:hypothetical protein
VQVLEPELKVLAIVCRIVLPYLPVCPWGGVSLEGEERLPQKVDADMVGRAL